MADGRFLRTLNHHGIWPSDTSTLLAVKMCILNTVKSPYLTNGLTDRHEI